MKKTQTKKAPAAIEPMTAVLRSTESGADMIKNYGKIEAVLEMFNDGMFTAVGALSRISLIIREVQP